MQKINYLKKCQRVVLALSIVTGSICMPTGAQVQAGSCPDLRIVFARGSGETRWEGQNYLEFRDRIDEKLVGTGINYDFVDLEYPAIEVGMNNLGATIGAFFGGGDAYEFGESVDAGVNELVKTVNSWDCRTTKFVVAGYSQGAMVVSKALRRLNKHKTIYAATFGDPKLYLPEGSGIMPAACMGIGLSDYRMYVPDCYAHMGLLGAYVPYEPENFVDKVGTWCNKRDIFCSSHLSISDHVSYVSENLYEDASRVIVGKISKSFGIENRYTSPHDTAILVDSTGSMSWMIDRFKSEAIRLANETFEAGGRVALYDYRDLADPYEPVARCNFETCTAENFSTFLNKIVAYGGGDDEESLLSASVKVMNELSWQRGATKSLVVLTDAPFLSPDRDKTTAEDVINLSKRIDPVNIYIITTGSTLLKHPEMAELAESTGGFATSKLGELNLLTDYIMDRYDTLPRVEETVDESPVPTLDINRVTDKGNTAEIEFTGTATGAIITLGDAVLGMTDSNSIAISELDRTIENTIRLVPINDSRKGTAAEVILPIMDITTIADETDVADMPTDDEPEVSEELGTAPEDNEGVGATISETTEEDELTPETEILTETQPEIVEENPKVPIIKDGFGSITPTLEIEPNKNQVAKKPHITETPSATIPKTPDTGIVK